MDSYIPQGGFSLPFQRRLSRLYNDTKKSSDFVKEPVQAADDPEIKALHRKLRIQKDRFVSWGLEWSESDDQDPEIDESLSKAGLSDLVGSIMTTIKDILAEAEPLWLASKSGTTTAPQPSGKSARDRKPSLIVWDKGRFEDLVRDLTASIDTLCDLSKTRSEAATTSKTALQRLGKAAPSIEDLRPYGPSRIQAPQVIDPSSIITLRSIREDNGPLGRPQDIALMTQQAYSELTRRPARQHWNPVLVEYGPFDQIYSSTGIMPSMTRFEKLSAGLQAESRRAPGAWVGLPQLLGYYENMEQSSLVLVFQYPEAFSPVTFDSQTQNPTDSLSTLNDLINRPDFEPRLEAKFRLANNLASSVFDMHSRGITHGNLRASAISFCNLPGKPGTASGEVDIRRPLISAFDIFPDSYTPDPDVASASRLYRHPLDPRTTPQSPLASKSDSKVLDLYSLAMILVSIGLWSHLENLVPNPSSPNIPESVLEQLAIRCGTAYMKAVQACWNAVESQLMHPNNEDEILNQAQIRTCRFLEACCILDGVSGLDERLSEETARYSRAARERSTPSFKKDSSSASTSKPSEKPVPMIPEEKAPIIPDPPAYQQTTIPNNPDQKDRSLFEIPHPSAQGFSDKKEPIGDVKDVKTSSSMKEQSTKMRLYPQVALSAEVVEQWNNMLMPQINMALKQFYRKNPESVEISLESIGESPLKVTPTVLVVCTSVKKVKSILMKKLGILFDGSTGFGLKVCRGSVLRSRKGPSQHTPKVRRSNAPSGVAASEDGSDYGTALNPDFQQRPQNGASIGAWIGDKHLPPVSFGGLILVDDKPYGMTVHHMLDDPEQTFAENPQESKEATIPTLRSSAASQHMAYMDEEASSVDGSEEFACEFSDSESEYSATDITSDYDDDEDEDDYEEFTDPGDIPGVEPGCGDGYVVTQPALDDIADGFYPEADTVDEDHLDTCSLGEIYASSGIRRRNDSGLIHEIDWALFEFRDDRLPDGNNRMPRAKHDVLCSSIPSTPSAVKVQPKAVVPVKSLPGLEVQCVARTSGIQTGQIMPALSSVKIYGRQSPSHTYQITGRKTVDSSGTGTVPTPSSTVSGRASSAATTGPLGIPGDSGAWVIERQNGGVCGHVLAWSERKQVAYICPMDILLQDIAETLQADEIRLPDGDVAVVGGAQDNRKRWQLHDIQSSYARPTGPGRPLSYEEEDYCPNQKEAPQLLAMHNEAVGGGGGPPPPIPAKNELDDNSKDEAAAREDDEDYEAAMRQLTAEMDKVHVPSSGVGVHWR